MGKNLLNFCGKPLCSQPTMSKLETAHRVEIARMMTAMVDLFRASFERPPAAITLDIDDTVDAVHGHQQLAPFHAHYNTHCILPIHIYEASSGKPVGMILRPGKTPDGREARSILKHVVKRIRRSWPAVRALIRGDSQPDH